LGESVATRPIELSKIFGNRRPVELEIGAGKGAFLLARAAARPELNFLGLERVHAYCHYAADRLCRAGLPNVRMLQAEASYFFSHCLTRRSLWRVHIYFPDPWPKRRHHRRRLMQLPFSMNVCRMLRPGGQLLIATDHLEYFEYIQAVMSKVNGLMEVAFPRMADRNGKQIETNFERKYTLQGRCFYRLARMRYV